MSTSDVFGLSRFVQAQAAVYPRVVEELRAGKKRSHWMWFIFPQMHGLGRSAMAITYAIRSMAEARAYLAHELLGPRLLECTQLVNAIAGKRIDEILPFPDDLKFQSSMTLFEAVSDGASAFSLALDKYFSGIRDELTRDLLARQR